MTGVPEFCERCGRQAEVPGINIVGNATNITIVGGGGVCSFCGGRTRTLEGTFDFRDGLIEMLSGPRWSRERLRQLAEIARNAASVSDGEIVQQVTSVEPAAGAALLGGIARGWSRADVIALCALLAAIIFGVLNLLPKGPTTIQLDPTQLRQIVQQIDDADVRAPAEPGTRDMRTPTSLDPKQPPPEGP